jgi:phenylpropionate dioxygenase-like ring-hydroxylating dioxygenase large terminal subunit
MFLYETHLPQILKPDDYHLPQQHQKELERLFLPAWHYVATLNDLARDGDYLTTTLFGRPLILWNIEGTVRAFLNVCPHRFTILTNKPRGHAGEHLKCQYHGWEFDECGDTQRIPDARSFRPMEKGELGLKAYRTETCGRLIFVTFDDHAPPLEGFLSPCWDLMQSLFTAQHRDVLGLDYEVDCNWKVKVENTLESYHVDLVHPTTFGQMPAAENCSEQLEPNWTSFFARQEAHTRFERTADRLLHRMAGAQQDLVYRHYIVYPHIMFAKLRMSSWIEVVYPVTPQRCRVLLRSFCNPGRPGRLRGAIVYWCLKQYGRRLGTKISAEDAALIPKVQQGLAAPEHPSAGLLSVREERVFHFQEYVKHCTYGDGKTGSHDARCESKSLSANQ